MRRHSERIGIRNAGDQIVVPGFLMNDHPGSVARLGQDGALILPFSSGQPARLDALTLPSGRWRIDARGLGRRSECASGPRRRRISDPALASSTPRFLRSSTCPVEPGIGVSMEVTPATDGPAELEQLVLTRVLD